MAISPHPETQERNTSITSTETKEVTTNPPESITKPGTVAEAVVSVTLIQKIEQSLVSIQDETLVETKDVSTSVNETTPVEQVAVLATQEIVSTPAEEGEKLKPLATTVTQEFVIREELSEPHIKTPTSIKEKVVEKIKPAVEISDSKSPKDKEQSFTAIPLVESPTEPESKEDVTETLLVTQKQIEVEERQPELVCSTSRVTITMNIEDRSQGLPSEILQKDIKAILPAIKKHTKKVTIETVGVSAIVPKTKSVHEKVFTASEITESEVKNETQTF
ncbi:hypothetical protein ILUMI_00803 [Ignelater luminosus]|uniref:Uncharacterized protein n=1 Tax=Ignelater luminosus TaxID=2038154 RepID=A0A8K0GI23_IGNLU|nr:hypothetical protein ILUMI_00803 [Ignelater luminosus]